MKRLIVCSDGTWNRPGITDNGKPVRSNVELIFNCISPFGKKDGKEVKQLKFYETGVGSSTFDDIDKVLGGIEGYRIDKKIMDIYSFVSMNYEKADEIFLFGFSRGAYTARSVAGFIRNCGILKKENIHLLQMAYDLYRDRNDYSVPDSDFMKGFRANYCVEDITPIKFIGVWDTVGSLGLPIEIEKNHNAEKYKFHDVKLSSYVENAYHALAVDERRKLFGPTLWELSENGIAKNQNLEQRWFPGVHCNVGGGYADTGLSDLALGWLISKAQDIGLAVESPSICDNPNYKFNPDYKGALRNSRTAMYWFWLPVRRQVCEKKRIKKREDGSQEEVVTNEVIDDSVKKRYLDPSMRYTPSNLKGLIQPGSSSS
ncbi:MAG: DUF2235 domain-containing protein [Bacteroidia bacterium]